MVLVGISLILYVDIAPDNGDVVVSGDVIPILICDEQGPAVIFVSARMVIGGGGGSTIHVGSSGNTHGGSGGRF